MSYWSAALRPNMGEPGEVMEKREDKNLVSQKASLEAAGYRVGLFWIPQQKLGLLMREIERLQKRTKRLNMKPLIFEKGAPYYTNVPSTTVKAIESAYGGREYREDTKVLRGEVTPVLVAGVEPRLSGWRLIACIDYGEETGGDGSWLRVVPGETLPPEYRTVDPTRCDHCLTKRDRSTVFVLAHDDGRHSVVGRTCLLDFLGGHGDPMAMANMAETLFALFDVARGMEEWGESGGTRMALAIEIEEFLAVAVHVIAKYGWISRSQAYASGRRGTATADATWDLCFPIGQMAREIARKERPTPEEHETAKKIVEWGTKEFVEADPSSLTDYGYNCRTALISGVVAARSAGVVASIPGAYQRAMSRLADVGSGGEVAGHYGTLNERIVLDLNFIGAKAIETVYGTSYLCTFRGASGPERGYGFKWFGSSWPFEFSLHEAPGKKSVRVKATIKKHGEWHGNLETELSRVAPLGPDEPKKAKRTSRPKKEKPAGTLPWAAPERTESPLEALRALGHHPGEEEERMSGKEPEKNPLSALRASLRSNTSAVVEIGEDASPAQAREMERVVDREASDGDRLKINARRHSKSGSRPPKRWSRPNTGKRTSRTGHPGAKRHSRPLWRNAGSAEMEEHRPGPGVMGRYFGRTVDPDLYSGTRGQDLDGAMKKYETFHAKQPLDVVDVAHEPPSRLVCIGDAEAVSYKTDKWYKDGNDIDYKHLHGHSETKPYETGKGVMFYENASLADPADIRANGTTRPPRAYPKAWTRLGKFLGCDIHRNDGEHAEVDSRKSARDCWLLCAPDGKMLAIYSPKPQDDGSEGFLAVMCGGNLRVLKDGIDG